METRAYEIRAGSEGRIIEGTAIVFDQPADLHGLTERILRSAIEGVDLNDITLLVNHDGMGIPLARSPKTMTLTVSDRGLEMRAELPDTEQGRSVYEAVRRGDLNQMSFAFDIADADYNTQTQERTITKIGRIYEVSVVNRAAYPQTNVQARKDLADDRKESDHMFNPITDSLNHETITTDTHSTPEYRSAFFKTLIGKDLTEAEQRMFGAAQAEKRADVFNTLSNSAAVVPDQTLNEIIQQARNTNGLYNEVRLFAVPANLSVPVGTPADPAAWHVEGAAVERGKLESAAVSFSAYELIKVLSLSAAVKRMELTAFESYLTQELRNAIADAIGAAIVNGTGSGQPVGLLSGITWSSSNSISVKALTADDLLKLIALLPAGYAGGAKLAMSTATLFGSVYPLKNGNGDFIFTDAVNGGGYRVFGFPVVIDDNIPAGTIIFGNFKYYGVNVPEGVAVEMSRESGFTSGLIDYRALCIADGKPIVPGAFVKLTISAA